MERNTLTLQDLPEMLAVLEEVILTEPDLKARNENEHVVEIRRILNEYGIGINVNGWCVMIFAPR